MINVVFTTLCKLGSICCNRGVQNDEFHGPQIIRLSPHIKAQSFIVIFYELKHRTILNFESADN